MITRDIYINSKQVTPPIRIVYGTDNLPVQFCMKDITLASGNTAKFYSLAPSENRYEQTGTINTTDQTITFTPEAGFFETGQNLLQCEITQSGKVIYSFVVDVLCGLNVMAEGTAAEAVNVKMWGERAEAAAETAEAIADNMGSAFPTGSASGAVASFPDGADGIPIKDMTVNIEPVQAGSGDPSPSNVRAISGWTAANIRRTGESLWGGLQMAQDILAEIPSATLDTENKTIKYNASAAAGKIFLRGSLKENTQYTVIYTGCKSEGSASGATNMRVIYTDDTYQDLPAFGSPYEDKQTKRYITTAGKTVKNIVGRYSSGISIFYYDECCLLEGVHTAEELVESTGTTYPISLGQTVYGGTLNPLTGVLTVDTAYAELTKNSNWIWNTNNALAICAVPNGVVINTANQSTVFVYNNMFTNSAWQGRNAHEYSCGMYYGASYVFVKSTNHITSLDDLETVLGDNTLQVAYKLATPFTVQLSPTQITTLLGQNNIWADCGDVSVTYRADPTLYIEGQIAPVKAMVASEETGTTASQAYTAGQYFIHDGQFCKALTNIASGATFTLGTNYSVTTIGAELYSALQS